MITLPKRWPASSGISTRSSAFTGVSGSGKSSLVNEILYKHLAKSLNRARIIAGDHDGIDGWEHFDKIISVQITLEVDKLQQKAEGTLHIAGNDLVAEAEHSDMYAAIDLLADRLDRQLIKHKEKHIGRQQGVNDR